MSEERDEIFLLVREGSRSMDDPRRPHEGQESIWTFNRDSGALEKRDALAWGGHGDRCLIAVTPDFIVRGSGSNAVRRRLGAKFWAARMADAGFMSGVDGGEFGAFDVFKTSIYPDSPLLFSGDMEGEMDGYFIMCWLLEHENVFLSITCISGGRVISRAVSRTTAGSISSSVSSEIVAIQRGIDGAEQPLGVSIAIIYFSDDDREIADACADSLSKNPSREGGDYSIGEPTAFDELWSERDKWGAPYRQHDYPVPYLSAGLLWGGFAVITAAAAAHQLAEVVGDTLRLRGAEASIVRTRAGIDAAADEIGALARTNIGKYAALYGITPESAAAFAQIALSPGVKMNVSASGAAWEATGRLPSDQAAGLRLRDEHSRRLPQRCRMAFSFDKSRLDGGEVKITCSGI